MQLKPLTKRWHATFRLREYVTADAPGAGKCIRYTLPATGTSRATFGSDAQLNRSGLVVAAASTVTFVGAPPPVARAAVAYTV
jgi:hypothetical protein